MLLRDGLGWIAFKDAVSGKVKFFLGQPVVQRFVSREWAGTFFDMMLNDHSVRNGDESSLVVRLNQVTTTLITTALITVITVLTRGASHLRCTGCRYG